MSPSSKIKIKETNEKKEAEDLAPEENGKLSPEGQLAVDVYETQNNFLVVAAVAGVSAKNLEVLVDKDMLVIKGSRQNPAGSSEKKNYFYQECYWGAFSRKILLPEYVDSSQIIAEMDNAILFIKFPKLPKEEKAEIKVKE